MLSWNIGTEKQNVFHVMCNTIPQYTAKDWTCYCWCQIMARDYSKPGNVKEFPLKHVIWHTSLLHLSCCQHVLQILFFNLSHMTFISLLLFVLRVKVFKVFKVASEKLTWSCCRISSYSSFCLSLLKSRFRPLADFSITSSKQMRPKSFGKFAKEFTHSIYN